jgi:hypothetical protein
MLRHRPRLLGGLLLTAALVVFGGVGHAAAPEDTLMPLEKYTTLKGKSLASAHRTRLLKFSEQIYNCLPWLDVRPGGLGFPRARDSQDDDRYLSTWIYVDQREDPVFAALPRERRVSAMFSRYGVDMLRRMSSLAEVVDDSDVSGLSVVLTWLKPGTSRPGNKAVNETFALFIDKTTLRSRSSTARTRWDGWRSRSGKIRSTRPTRRPTSSPRKGPSAPSDRGPLRARPAPFLAPGLTPPGGSDSIKSTR